MNGFTNGNNVLVSTAALGCTLSATWILWESRWWMEVSCELSSGQVPLSDEIARSLERCDDRAAKRLSIRRPRFLIASMIRWSRCLEDTSTSRAGWYQANRDLGGWGESWIPPWVHHQLWWLPCVGRVFRPEHSFELARRSWIRGIDSPATIFAPSSRLISRPPRGIVVAVVIIFSMPRCVAVITPREGTR